MLIISTKKKKKIKRLMKMNKYKDCRISNIISSQIINQKDLFVALIS